MAPRKGRRTAAKKSEPPDVAGTAVELAAESRRAARQKRADEVRRKYDFGIIRSLRRKKGLTIEKFARVCGLSYAPISRIETNLIKPTLETLDKIASGLDITTYNLVALAERREAERHKAHETGSGGFRWRTLAFDGIDLCLGSAAAGAVVHDPEIPSRDRVAIIVQDGLLEVTANEKTFEIGAGEAVSFDCVYPSRYRALENTEFQVLLQSSDDLRR